MMNYPTALLLNTLFLFSIALPCDGGELIVNWVRDTEKWQKKVSSYDKNPNFRCLGIDPEKVVTAYDYQRAVVAYFKTKKINVSIRNRSAHHFLQDIVGGRLSWPAHRGIRLSVCLKDRPGWVQKDFPDRNVKDQGLSSEEIFRKKIYNYKPKGLKATEGDWAGKVCRDPWAVYNANEQRRSQGFVKYSGKHNPEFINSQKDYIIERFFDDWNIFWSKMEQEAKNKGFKTLDSFVIDEYSGYCLEKFGQPFWFHLSPLHLKSLSDSRTGPFKKLSHYAQLEIEKNDTNGKQNINHFSFYKNNVNKPLYESSDPESWAVRWDYIMWNIKWILIFEVWDNTDLGEEVRRGRFLDLVKDRESGYPYRVSFDFEGTIEDFIVRTIEMYNGKTQNVYLTFGSDVLNGRQNGITIHL